MPCSDIPRLESRKKFRPLRRITFRTRRLLYRTGNDLEGESQTGEESFALWAGGGEDEKR